MKSHSKSIFALFLLVPLVLGAVASKQRGGRKDTPPNADSPKASVKELAHSATAASAPTLSNPDDDVGSHSPIATSSALNYAVDWYSINGGGTTNASSTNYQLGVSVGQSVAGVATSTNYQMGVGFWYGVTGGCSCPCKHDPQCDGVISDILDVTLTINRAFRGAVLVQDPGCPVERTDVNASSATDVIDVTKVINVAFRGMSVASQYVDPCAP